jgi:hypothetical protein
VQLLEHANSCASDNLRKGQVRACPDHLHGLCSLSRLCSHS